MDTVLLDSADLNQSDIDANTQGVLSRDHEFNGSINRAASEGAKFALILAMLEQDCTHRPQLEKTKEPNHIQEDESEFNHYRNNPLQANDSYWQTSQYTSQLIHSGQLHTAQLWLAMHPEPLSKSNNPLEINEEVMANCSVNTQARMQQAKQNLVKVDETGLYDILQELEPLPV